MPQIDNAVIFRTVQVLRRLSTRQREIGLFCNLAAESLFDAAFFSEFIGFAEANKALAETLVFELSQEDVSAFGPIEQESLAALSEQGFRFSLDHVTDLRFEPKDLAEHSFRFLKVPAKLLLNKSSAQSDIHPQDLADLLARSGIDLIAERIENESMVVDLLDYDVRFGQGFLFSPPRPVRAEALQSGAGEGAADPVGVMAGAAG